MPLGPKAFLRRVNPTGAIADFRQVFRDAGPNRWWFALLAAIATAAVFSLMTGQSWKKQRQLPQVTYITSWPADRTAEETRAFIAENQRRKDAAADPEAELQAERQQLWMTLGRATGVDVDRLKRGADADRAAEAAKAKARTDAILRQSGIDPAEPDQSAPKPESGPVEP